MLAFRKRISYKQTKWTLSFLLVLSVVLSALQVLTDWENEKRIINSQTRALLNVVADTATEAAFELNANLGRKVLSGLMASNQFYEAVLLDDIGRPLSKVSRPKEVNSLSWLLTHFFGELKQSYTFPLIRSNGAVVGSLRVKLDKISVTSHFLERNWYLVISILLSVLLLGGAVAFLFYLQITRPLFRFIESLSILDKDKSRLDQTVIPAVTRDDEIGILARTIVALWHKRKKVESRLATSEAYFKAVLKQSSECMLLANVEGKIRDCNDRTCVLLGHSAEELQKMGVCEVSSDLTEERFQKWSKANHGETTTFEADFTRSNGDSFPAEVCGSIIVLDGQKYFLASFRDITLRKKSQEQARLLAYYDTLTSLPNRRLFNEKLNEAIALATANKQFGGVFFIDLDRFKNINDTLGHHVGDSVLVEVADRISAILPEHAIAARIGGDEFVVLIPSFTRKKELACSFAEELAQKLLSVLTPDLNIDNADLRVSASIGVSLFPADDTSLPVLQQADTAMYEAKKQGRNGYQFYHPDMQHQLKERLDLEKALQLAIEGQEFKLLYQPQVDSKGNLVGLEALVRWHSETLGPVSPAKFIPVAEETGVIKDIGNWVLQEACQQLRQWQDAALPVHFERLAINISPVQFAQPEFVNLARNIIAESGADPNLLEFEITESMLVENIPLVADKMNQLRELGVRFSIDDFGTGYSSLRYLQHFPVSQLKIDQSFTRDVADDPKSQVIINTIVAMANLMQFEVLAEGVETEQERDFLFDVGCVRYQGYFFSKPIPPEQVSEQMPAGCIFC
ncbi:sensor domain-containing protein [Marinomonas epiphytica]